MQNLQYMLGVIVVANDSQQISIVDGQQRIVTLTLIFCAIRDIIKKIQLESDILTRFLAMLDNAAKNNKIELHDHRDNTILKKIIRGEFADNDKRNKMLKDKLPGQSIKTRGQRALLKNYDLLLRRSKRIV